MILLFILMRYIILQDITNALRFVCLVLYEWTFFDMR